MRINKYRFETLDNPLKNSFYDSEKTSNKDLLYKRKCVPPNILTVF